MTEPPTVDDDRRRNYKPPRPLDPESFPHKARSGVLPGTIENMEHLLDGYGISVRYDVIRKKLLVRSDLWSSTSDNCDNVALTNIVSFASLNRLARSDVEALVAAVGDKRPYNPVQEWIESRPWDGRDRLSDIYGTLEVRDDYPVALKEVLIHKWLLSAVAAALRPRFRSRGVLTLQGPQSMGKTQWVASLVPDAELRAAVVKLDHHMDAHNKDSILGAVCHWLVEIGELDSAMRRDIARLKGVLTRDSDKVRKPYARAESEMFRKTVFAATVNHQRFLADDTGNSRWWVLPLVRVDWQHSIDMQQLFAQLAKDLEAGAAWWLTAEEERLLDEQNRPHRAISAIEEQILDELELERVNEADLPAMSARDVLVHLDIKYPTNPQCKECAGVLREYLGESKRIQGKDTWRIPLRRDQQRTFAVRTKDPFD